VHDWPLNDDIACEFRQIFVGRELIGTNIQTTNSHKLSVAGSILKRLKHSIKRH